MNVEDQKLESQIHTLRRLLWEYHGCGRDMRGVKNGHRVCVLCGIDFDAMPPEEMERQLRVAVNA